MLEGGRERIAAGDAEPAGTAGKMGLGPQVVVHESADFLTVEETLLLQPSAVSAVIPGKRIAAVKQGAPECSGGRRIHQARQAAHQPGRRVIFLPDVAFISGEELVAAVASEYDFDVLSRLPRDQISQHAGSLGERFVVVGRYPGDFVAPL